ncbi:MAG: hypothetical protein AAGC67_05015 [Myxococcota bacterium]
MSRIHCVSLLLSGLFSALLAPGLSLASPSGPGGLTDGIDTASTLVVDEPRFFVLDPFDDPSDCGADCEWHRVHLVKGARYAIEIEFPPIDDFLQTLLPTQSLWEFTGAGPIASDVVPDEVISRVVFEPTETADYYVAVGYDTLEDPRTLAGSAYRIEVILEDDIGEGSSTNGRAGGTFPQQGAIELPGDMDWYRVSMEAGQRYTFLAETTVRMDDPLASPELELRAPNQAPLAYGAQSAGTAELVYTPNVSGDYYVVVNAPGDETGQYQLSTSGGNLPADPSTWARLEVDGLTEKDVIQNTNDRDWFRISLVEGRRYGIFIGGTSTRRCGCSLYDPAGALYDAEGNLLMRDEDSGWGRNAQLDFMAPYTGEYFVEVSTQQSGSGIYNLVAQEDPAITPPADDWVSDASARAHVRSARGWRGAIETPGDADWFVTDQHLFHERYVYEVESLEFRALDLALIENGVELDDVTVTRTGRTTRLVYSPSETSFEPRWLEVRSEDGDAAGAYVVRALEGEIPDDGSSTAILQVGESYRSAIAFSQDRDFFPIALEAGLPYTVRIEGDANGVGTLRCGRVALRSPAGDIVAEADPGPCTVSADAALSYVPTETGSFVVEATRGESARTARGTYRISVVPEPGFGIALVGGALALAALGRGRR